MDTTLQAKRLLNLILYIITNIFNILGISHIYQTLFKIQMTSQTKSIDVNTQSTPHSNHHQGSETPQTTPQNLISNDLEIKLSALSMALKQLPQLIQNYFYNSAIPIDQNRIMMFELLELSTLERVFEELKEGFTKELIQGDKSTNPTHRLQFHDILSSQLLPLMSTSKFELINICLIGFDMYVKPFDAILDIVNKIAKFTSEVKALNVDFGGIVSNGLINKEDSIFKGYNQFVAYSKLFLIGFYTQMLQEYLKKASKVLQKKDRQIIFTGCTTLYDTLVPILVDNKLFTLLYQITNLNYQLWLTNNGFDYFYLYTKLPIQQELQPVFYTIKKIMDKTLLSNTLTPFIFGVLRNYQSFVKFFQTIDNPIWSKYAQATIMGIILTLKSKSLPFKEMIDLINTILECGRFSNSVYQVFIENIDSDLGEQWSDIDSFFRSGLKAGYHSGVYALFHKLTEQELKASLQQLKYTGLLKIKKIQQQKIIQWIKLIEPDKQVRNIQFLRQLQKQIKFFDGGFSAINIDRLFGFKSTYNCSQKVVIEDHLLHIMNCIRVLRIGEKDLLSISPFKKYLSEMLSNLNSNQISTQQFNLFLFEDSLSRQWLQATLLFKLSSKQLSESVITKVTDKILNKHILSLKVQDNFINLTSLIQIPSLYTKYKSVLEKVFLSQLYRLTKNYIQYSFEGMNLEDIEQCKNIVGFYLNKQQLQQILQNKYTIKEGFLRYSQKRPRNSKSHIVKTFSGQIQIDKSLFQLTPNAKLYLSGLLQVIALNPTEEKHIDILIQLVDKFPVVNYYVLTFPVPTKQLKSLVNNSSLPQYLSFSSFVIKSFSISQKYLIVLKKLMSSCIFISYDSQNLLKQYLNINIIDEILRDISKLSKGIVRQKLYNLLSSLYQLISKHLIIEKKYYKDIVPPALSILRTLIRISDKQLAQLTKLFDGFVRLSLGKNYQKLIKEIQVDHLRVGSTSIVSTANSPIIEFPTLEIMILHQDQGLPELQIQPEKQQIINYNQLSLDLSTLKFNILQEKQNEKQEISIFEASSNFILSPVIEDIIGDSPIKKVQSQFIEKYYTSTYLYPQLTTSQLHTVIRDFFINSSDISYCLFNTANGFKIMIFALGILIQRQKLESKEPYRTIIKDCDMEDIIQKCMYMIQKIGYMKFLNHPITSMTNIPIQYKDIKQTIKSQLPLIFQLLKSVLSRPELISTGFIARYPSEDILLRSHQIFYDLKIDSDTIRMILQRLSQLGVYNLSSILHSNSQSLRLYFEILYERTNELNLSSYILNYHELFKLTKDPLSDIEFIQKVQDFKRNIEFYVKIIVQRLRVISEETKSSLYYKHKNGKNIETILSEYSSERLNSLINIVSAIKQFMFRCSIQDILKRHSQLYKEIITSCPSHEVIPQLQIIHIFKQICLQFSGEQIVLPNFIYHNRQNSIYFEKQQLKLSQMIQNWQQYVFPPKQKQILSVQNKLTLDITLQQIINLETTTNTSYRIVSNGKQLDDSQLITNYIKQLIDLKLISHDKKVTLIPTQLKDQFYRFKILGFLCGNMALKGKKLPFILDEDMLAFLSLQKLPWRLVQNKNKKIFNDIMIVLKDDISIKQLNLMFQYSLDSNNLIELVPRGSERKVTEANKKQYCNLLALTQIEYQVQQARQFVNGFYKVYTLGGNLLKL